MDKLPQSNQKRAIENSKNKKKQPLKVVYITNPIMFKTDSASEFRALVQEFTGKDAETPEYSDYAAVEAVKAVAEDNNVRCSTVDTEETKVEIKHDEFYYPNCHDMVINGRENMVQLESDPMVFDSVFDNNVFNDPKMLENVDGLEGSRLGQESFSSLSSSSTTTTS